VIAFGLGLLETPCIPKLARCSKTLSGADVTSQPICSPGELVRFSWSVSAYAAPPRL
jgi:hypothetical protein